MKVKNDLIKYIAKPTLKPNKPVLDLETGLLYLNGNTMKDLERNVKKENIIIEEVDNDVGL